MAEDSRSCLRCLDRRSVLRGTAAYVAAAAFADGCTTSDPYTLGAPNGREGGVSDAGVGGQAGTGRAGTGGNNSGGGLGGVGGGTTDEDSGAVGGIGGDGGNPTVGTGGANGNSKPDGGSVDAGDGVALCPGAMAVGKATRVAMGAVVAVGYGLVVGRDASGLYAMSSLCTHQGCETNVVGPATQPTLHCPCHGSNFSASGAVTRGPARVPLVHLQLLVSASGDLTICSNVVVPTTTRTPG